MAKNLVIVESPAKVKTIKKFIGPSYEVMASMGHVRDLPKSSIGIDEENDFEPRYITIRGKGELLAELRKASRNAQTIYLATDPDREGEAISWHLIAALGQDTKKFKRISFNEITKTAVKNSLKNPRAIDMNLVDAQQARRVIDRLVGYKISPVLWEKVKRGLSAGRVQSVALRIIADREEEINAFIPSEYWTMDAEFDVPGEKKKLTAHFYGTDRKKMTIGSKAEADEIEKAVRNAECVVQDVRRGERVRRAPLPFTTSTLQQEASRKLNFSTQKTMRLAQQLYEGVDIKGRGTIGVITYLRTDSTRVAEEAGKAAASYIGENYGPQYVGKPQQSANPSKNVQDAHEAIRPTDITLTPALLKDSLQRDLFRLYQLIWKRFTASAMADAVYDTQSVRIQAGEYTFNMSASKIRFPGFTDIYPAEEEEVKNTLMGTLPEEGMKLSLAGLKPEQHFTQPPAHFTEASLVHTLEELGIGRPSTYAPTITTIINRRYVTREQKNLYLTELGDAVNQIMKKAFPIIVDENFTANLETLFDGIADGFIDWKTVVRNFYPDLKAQIDEAHEKLSRIRIEDEVTDEVCELCGRNMVLKYGPHGKFLACPGFPECRNTKPYFEKVGVACPLCGGDVVLRRTKKGRRYFGCMNHPECTFMSWQKPSDKKCPVCGSYMTERGNILVCSDEKCGYRTEIKKDSAGENGIG
ncbi:MAG: type I DNA topoisomerase [Lachnospiraceae bacterium]|nr:type I DNA topoisomerase [Lachnospiraceae bacterium]